MSKIWKKSRERNADHQKYISRITKTLYYGQFAKTDGLSLPVTELASELFSEAQRGKSLDRLHYDDAANISRHAHVPPCSLVIAILYLERLKQMCPEYLEKTASSDIFLVSLMVSCKFLYDDGEDNEVLIKKWAKSGGTTVSQLVELEKNFLKAIEWNVFVSEDTFWRKLDEIETMIAKKQGACRGFFTYTEIKNLLNTLPIQALIENVFSISVILTASYAAALLGLFGSVFIVSQVPGTHLQLQQGNEFTESKGVAINENDTTFALEETDMLSNDIITDHLEGNTSTDGNIQNVSWNWWVVPTMTWLSAISTYVEQKSDMSNGFISYLEDIYMKFHLFSFKEEIRRTKEGNVQTQFDNSWHIKSNTMERHLYNKYFRYIR